MWDGADDDHDDLKHQLNINNLNHLHLNLDDTADDLHLHHLDKHDLDKYLHVD